MTCIPSNRLKTTWDDHLSCLSLAAVQFRSSLGPGGPTGQWEGCCWRENSHTLVQSITADLSPTFVWKDEWAKPAHMWPFVCVCVCALEGWLFPMTPTDDWEQLRWVCVELDNGAAVHLCVRRSPTQAHKHTSAWATVESWGLNPWDRARKKP